MEEELGTGEGPVKAGAAKFGKTGLNHEIRNQVNHATLVGFHFSAEKYGLFLFYGC